MTGHFDSQDESRTIDWRSSGTVAEVEGTRQQLQKVRLHVSTLGCQIKPGSRIAVFEQHFSRFMEPGYNPRRDSDFSPILLAHGVRDVFELLFICEEFAKGHRDELRSALPDLLSGATIPSDDRNQKARNLQFQYFLTAQLLHSGFTVGLDEPDADGVVCGPVQRRPTEHSTGAIAEGDDPDEPLHGPLGTRAVRADHIRHAVPVVPGHDA